MLLSEGAREEKKAQTAPPQAKRPQAKRRMTRSKKRSEPEISKEVPPASLSPELPPPEAPLQTVALPQKAPSPTVVAARPATATFESMLAENEAGTAHYDESELLEVAIDDFLEGEW